MTRARAIDMTGARVGTLTVITRAPRTVKGAQWVCRCDCGRQKILFGSNLRRGSAACGCGSGHQSHGMSRTGSNRGHALYGIWTGIRQRTSNPVYRRYAGRGIRLCESWAASFQDFFEWAITHGWEPGLQVDRRDNDGDYSPENCRIVTRLENARNRSTNRLLEYQGSVRPVCEWAEELGLPARTIYGRLDMGWTAQRALSTPRRVL